MIGRRGVCENSVEAIGVNRAAATPLLQPPALCQQWQVGMYCIARARHVLDGYIAIAHSVNSTRAVIKISEGGGVLHQLPHKRRLIILLFHHLL